MMRRIALAAIPLAAVLAVGCGEPAGDPTGIEPSFDRGGDGGRHAEWSAWSEPVNLGGAINTPVRDESPGLSPDELSLYFVSDRPGGVGGTDLWVSRRASWRRPWGTPVNLGAVINTSVNESSPSLSSDGHLLFFQSNRPGGQGMLDIWVSRRADPKNDFTWEAPVNLGPHVNTALSELGPEYVPAPKKHGSASLYFGRRQAPLMTAPQDLYSAPISRDGLPGEPAVPISELNTPTGEGAPEVSTDGRELLITSDRPGTLGGMDLWRSTRRSVRDPWSTPENLGTPINTAFIDQGASLSGDGRTLIFYSDRPGGSGGTDLWMSTRTLIGEDDDDDGDDDDNDGDDG